MIPLTEIGGSGGPLALRGVDITVVVGNSVKDAAIAGKIDSSSGNISAGISTRDAARVGEGLGRPSEVGGAYLAVVISNSAIVGGEVCNSLALGRPTSPSLVEGLLVVG